MCVYSIMATVVLGPSIIEKRTAYFQRLRSQERFYIASNYLNLTYNVMRSSEPQLCKVSFVPHVPCMTASAHPPSLTSCNPTIIRQNGS